MKDVVCHGKTVQHAEAKMAPEARAKAEEQTRQLMKEMPLQELRQASPIVFPLPKMLPHRTSRCLVVSVSLPLHHALLSLVVLSAGNNHPCHQATIFALFDYSY